MILEERPDGQGTGEDSFRQQDDGSIRKVGIEEGCGSPTSRVVQCGLHGLSFLGPAPLKVSWGN